MTTAVLPLLLAVFTQEADLAFTHVDLVPMDEEHVLSDHTVLVAGDRIVAIGPSAEMDVPEDCQVVEGRGLYLMPGIADMHVHSWFPDEHLLFLANGVTTVRNMFGSPMHVMWRDEIASGERLGPTFYTAGPIVDGKPATWPGSIECTTFEEGRAAVEGHLEPGYDFVKVYSSLTQEAFDGVVEAAAGAGLPVMGHVPAAVGVETALAAGQRTMEHLSEVPRLLVDPELLEQRRDMPLGLELWEHVDPGRFSDVVADMRDAGTWNCPTLVVLQQWLAPEEIELELEKPYVQHVLPASISMWKNMASSRSASMRDTARRGEAGRMAFVRALQEGGARLLLGTDMGNPFVPAGYSVHWELENFVEAGLSPYEALRAGTYEAAACMDALDEFGTIAVGLRADLLLLDANPLEEIGNAARIRGVTVRGRYLSRRDLDERLAR